MDTAAKEREVEERLKKEQERLQRQLEEDKNRGPERKPRERYIPTLHHSVIEKLHIFVHFLNGELYRTSEPKYLYQLFI